MYKSRKFYASFSDILPFFYTISLSITRIIYKIRLYNVCHRGINKPEQGKNRESNVWPFAYSRARKESTASGCADRDALKLKWLAFEDAMF